MEAGCKLGVGVQDAGIPKLILIVDDDPDTRVVLSQLLTHCGYRAQTASNGAAALDYLRSNPAPCLVLLDLMMPLMDGWEFIRQKNRDPATAIIPVIAVTALTALKRTLDVKAVVRKPVDFDQLLTLVQQYC